MSLIKLYFEFFKIGLFSIGGGLATLPFLQKLVDKYEWLTSSELVNMIAISESTPGAIGINTATFVGYEAAGVFGGIITTLGIITPSIIIIVIIAHYFSQFNQKPVVVGAFNGIRPAVAGLIASVGFSVLKLSVLDTEILNTSFSLIDLINVKEAVLFIIMMYLISKYKKNPITYLALSAVIGIIFKL